MVIRPHVLTALVITLAGWQAAEAGILPGGDFGDEQTSIVYDTASGELEVNTPASSELTSINIHSVAGIFSAELPHCFGSFCQDIDDNSLFRASFREGFGDFSWGNIADPGLEEQFILDDLTVVGSLRGGGGLSDVDLIYIPIPEPSTLTLTALSLPGLLALGWRWRKRHASI